jgi:hypothetical protein
MQELEALQDFYSAPLMMLPVSVPFLVAIWRHRAAYKSWINLAAALIMMILFQVSFVVIAYTAFLMAAFVAFALQAVVVNIVTIAMACAGVASAALLIGLAIAYFHLMGTIFKSRLMRKIHEWDEETGNC